MYESIWGYLYLFLVEFYFSVLINCFSTLSYANKYCFISFVVITSYDYVFSENGLVAYKDGVLVGKQVVLNKTVEVFLILILFLSEFC